MTLYRRNIPGRDEYRSKRTDVSPFDIDGRPVPWSDVLAAAVGESMLVPVELDIEAMATEPVLPPGRRRRRQ